MNWLSSYAVRNKEVLNKTWFQWVLAIIIFFLISWFFMGSGITSCTTSTPAFNSDTSGGTAWFQWASGNDLGWNYTSQSNYPVGEQLNRPQGITALAFSGLYRVFATLTTPICGINLMILLGYLSTALVMFGLVRWLFKSSSLALLAGFAAAYTPYSQFKSQSHVVYMYSSVFIAITWAFLWFVNKPSYRRAILPAALTVLGVYIDGYFVLLAGVLLVCLVGFNMLRSTIKLGHKPGAVDILLRYRQFWLNIKKNIVHVGVMVVAIIILSLPVVYVLKKQGNEIRQSLSASRGNIYAESVTYGARLYDYITPAFNNYFMPSGYAQWRSGHNHDSNSSEDTLYIAAPILALAVAGVVLVLGKKNRSTKLTSNISYAYVIGLCLATILVCLVFASPSKITLLNHTFKTPLWYFVGIFENWRVFSRFILIIQPLTILLAICCLYVVQKHLSSRRFIIFVAIVWATTAALYISSPVRFGGDLIKNTPEAYKMIKDDSAVRVIAEYPLTNFLYTPSTFTFQQYHGKPVYNANDSAIILSPLNRSIAGLGDVQSAGVLKARGVSHVISRSGGAQHYKGLNLYYGKGDDDLVVYAIDDSVLPRFFALAPMTHFEFAGLDKNNVSHYVLAGQGTMGVIDIDNQNRTPSNGKVQTSVMLRTLGDTPAEVTITQNGVVLWAGTVDAELRAVEFSAQKGDITLTTTQSIDASNFSAVED